ncbi:MAG TPA: hypothetical protein VHQ94_20395 [Pyrinomonadaceae bacterium]|nr:hypothetical protein [Pyrinomonadaceae bacterium]
MSNLDSVVQGRFCDVALPQSRKSFTVSSKRFREQRLLTTSLQRSNCGASRFLSEIVFSFEQKCLCSGIFCTCGTPMITNAEVQRPGSRQVLLRFAEPADACKQETNVVFNPCLKPPIPNLLEVETGCSKLNQSTVDIILSLFSSS